MNDETETQEDLPGMVPVGERLREAREAKKMGIEDIASKTRIPKRHLESLEKSEWERLPAPTYTIGFAKAYAGEVGLDRDEILAQLREELGQVPAPAPSEDGYEIADPARSFPRWLIWLAVVAVVAAVIYFTYNNEKQLGADEPKAADLLLEPEDELVPPSAQTAGQPPAADDVVTLIAEQPVDIRITDGESVVVERSLAPGERFLVPAAATAPMLAVNDASRLRVTVGETNSPPVGGSGPANGISLLGPSLLGQAPGGNAGFGTPPSQAAEQRAAEERAASRAPAPSRPAPRRTREPEPQASSQPRTTPAAPAQRAAPAQDDSIFNSDAPPPPPLNPPRGGQDAG